MMEEFLRGQGPFSIEFSVSGEDAVRVTRADGQARVQVGAKEARTLFQKATAAGIRLWSADAATAEEAHRTFIVKCGSPRLFDGRTADRTMAPGKGKEAPPADRVRAVVTSFNELPPQVKQHIVDVEAESSLWRTRANQGYRVDSGGMQRERQSRHRLLDGFTRDLGLDVRRQDIARLPFLRTFGDALTVTQTTAYGWSHPSAVTADIEAMNDDQKQLWAAYKAAHSVLKRAQILDSWHRRLTVEGRLHPVIHANSAATGRMSMSGAALQSAPKELRHLILTEPGNSCVSVDHTSAELKVLAAFLNDAAFTALIATGDIYQVLADESGLERKQAKVATLAFVYGQSLRSLGRTLGADAASQFHAAIRHVLPQVPAWQREMADRGKRGQDFQTLTGRPLPRLAEPGRTGQVPNLLIQGSARDAFGVAVRRTVATLGADVLFIPLHDELFIEVPRAQTANASMALVSAMTVEVAPGVVLSGTAEVTQGRWADRP